MSTYWRYRADKEELGALGIAAQTRIEQVGALIRKHREAAGMSQLVLAAKLAISRGQVARIEHGTRSYTVDLLARISLVLGRPLFDFVPKPKSSTMPDYEQELSV